ncbi:MAG: hypothetical protein OWS74_06665, partial [Firmicutes bacterium]|nr:hypothetical protein [Bacillota bacterium]
MITLYGLDLIYAGPGQFFSDGYLVFEEPASGGRIVAIGQGPAPHYPGRRINGRGKIAVPGLVNTHHHLFQTLTRAAFTDQGLFGWLDGLVAIWRYLTPDAVYWAALV